MIKEQSSLETDTEQIVRLIEENLKLRKQLADQKAKTIRYINDRIKYCTHSANEFKACKDNIAMNQMYARVNELKGLLKEFEELTK